MSSRLNPTGSKRLPPPTSEPCSWQEPRKIAPSIPRGQVALTPKPDERTNPHGVPGHIHIVRDSLESKECTGFG
jgi:hypothetical protein